MSAHQLIRTIAKDHRLVKFVLIQHLTNSNITRFSTNNNLILPKVRTNYGSQRVAFVLIKLWNSLSYNIKCAFSISSFKHQLRNVMFNPQHRLLNRYFELKFQSVVLNTVCFVFYFSLCHISIVFQLYYCFASICICTCIFVFLYFTDFLLLNSICVFLPL